jgi:hypothetical protein
LQIVVHKVTCLGIEFGRLLDERCGFYVIVKMLKDKRILDRITRIDRMNFLALRKIAKKGTITRIA